MFTAWQNEQSSHVDSSVLCIGQDVERSYVKLYDELGKT